MTSLPCGCTFQVDESTQKIALAFCTLHTAAPRMYELLELVGNHLSGFGELWERIQFALAAAKGE